MGSLSDTVGRRPLMALWNFGWLFRPLGLMATSTLRGRLIVEVAVSVIGGGGPAAWGAAYADLFGTRPELSVVMQGQIAMWNQLTNLAGASVAQLISSRWGLQATFAAAAAFAAASLGVVLITPETLPKAERKPD